MNNVFIMPCEMQHVYTCHNRRQLGHVNLNIIIIVSSISMKHHMKYANVWTNNAVQ